MAKVESIVDSSFKSGEKNGKRWTLAKITADGKEATGFGPVAVGDEVDLTYNEQYRNYGFKKLGPQDIPSVQVNADLNDSGKLLELIYADTQKILKLVDKSGYDKAKEVAGSLPRPDNVVEDIGDEPINLQDIPF